MAVLLGFLLGMSAGLRSMTPPAAVAWAAQGWPEVQRSHLAFMAAPLIGYILTAAACVELVVDKLPFTPSRLKPGPLGARIVLGALCGAALFVATRHSIAAGAIAGGLGGAAGAFAGYHARRTFVATFRIPDLVVALVEDAIAIALAVSIVWQI